MASWLRELNPFYGSLRSSQVEYVGAMFNFQIPYTVVRVVFNPIGIAFQG